MKNLKRHSDSKKLQKAQVGEAESFDLDQDLSELLADPNHWRLASFELSKPKDTSITMRMSSELLEKVKDRAQKMGVDYQKLIRLTLEQLVRKESR